MCPSPAWGQLSLTALAVPQNGLHDFCTSWPLSEIQPLSFLHEHCTAQEDTSLSFRFGISPWWSGTELSSETAHPPLPHPSHTTNRPEAEDEPKLPSRAVPPAQELLLDKLQVLRLLIWLCGLVVNPGLKLSISSFTRLNAAARCELTRGPGQLEEKLHFYKLCFFKAYEVKRRARTQNRYLKCKTGSSVAELSRSSPTKHTGISAQIPVQDNEAWRIVYTMQFSFPPNHKSQKLSPAPSCLYNIYLLNKQTENYPRYLNSALNFTE